MNSIYKKPEVSPKRGRNGFDVSQRNLFSASTGQLLPIYSDFAYPGDEYNLNLSAFIRTEAVETAAMTRFVAHFDAFFVPFRQMYQFYNEFYNSVFDAHTSFVSQTDNFSLPYFDMNKVVSHFEEFPFFGQFTNTTSDDPATLNVDEFGVPLVWNFRRLYSFLNYGNPTKQYDAKNPNYCNLFRFLAYHKIYYSHYNLTDWFAQRPDLYNVDKFHGTGLSDTIGFEIVSTLHYRPWRKDYFNNFLPTPTFSNAYSSLLQNGWLKGGNDIRYEVAPEGVKTTELTTGANETVGVVGDIPRIIGANLSALDKISANDIRSVFALDRLLRVTGQAGGHYDQQTYAHFGVKLPQGLSNEAYFIGSCEVPINISEVVSQASTGAKDNQGNNLPGNVIGDIAGKGFGANNGSKMKFKCDEAGVVMVIFSIEPLLEYSSQSVDVTNRYRTSLDFYHPELDDLGMQPMDDNYLNGSSHAMPFTKPDVIGWQYRYSESKSKWDSVHESISDTDKAAWQVNFLDSLAASDTQSFDRFARFYINPQYANPIFALEFPKYLSSTATYDNTTTKGFLNNFNKPENIYCGDNFIVNSDIQAFKTSIMSVHSLPKIN